VLEFGMVDIPTEHPH